jgi:hypothetical protein
MRPKIKFIKTLKRLLMNQDNGLLSIQTNTEMTNSLEQTKPMESQLKGTYHQTCKTLKYADFLIALITGDLKSLVISGEIDTDILKETWQDILQEYSSYLKTDKSESIFDCWKKLEYTKWKMNFVAYSLEALKIKYSQVIAEELQKVGYDYIVDNGDSEDYFRQIYNVQMEAKNLVVFYNQYAAEYTKLCPEADREPITRDEMSYEKELRILGRFMGYNIRKEDITVFEFCSIINTYIESNKKSKD